jgi:hypothetical protein
MARHVQIVASKRHRTGNGAERQMCGNAMDIAVPAANGSANPAISLSAVISLLFFAKIAINFLTLRGYGKKLKINYKTLSI